METASAPLIDFRNATVLRGGRVVLDALSLCVHSAEDVAIVGPNGCGKSTLIKTITRELYPQPEPDSWVRILGEDRWNVFDLRSHLGIVSNDLAATCTRDITGREAVISGFFSSVGIWPHQHVTSEMQDRAQSALERVEAVHLADRYVDEMSSGEVRRIVIARALVHDPQALILDEPSNSLDIRAMKELRDTLRGLAASGTSMILVTHHLPDIIPEISRVVLMRGGRIYRDGPKQELLSQDVLSEFFDMPVHVTEHDGYRHIW